MSGAIALRKPSGHSNKGCMRGPYWLSQSIQKLPSRKLIVVTPESLEEAKRASVCAVQDVSVSGVTCIIDFKRFSELDRLLRVTALVLRFIFNVRAHKKGSFKVTGEVRSEEIVKLWILGVQSELKAMPNFTALMIGVRHC